MFGSLLVERAVLRDDFRIQVRTQGFGNQNAAKPHGEGAKPKKPKRPKRPRNQAEREAARWNPQLASEQAAYHALVQARLGMTGVGPRWSEGRLRTLLTEAVELYRWRGTRYGLTRMIEVCTGITPVVAETASNPNVLHIRVVIPPESEIDRETLERLVIANKPAHTAYILDVAA